MYDLHPAAAEVTRLLDFISDAQLDYPTPCEGTNVAAMLDHLMGLTLAFHDAAVNEIPDGGSQPPKASAKTLDSSWRDVLPQRLENLADVWNTPESWEGMTEAGGVKMPAEVMGVVALDELVLHGWDLARGTNQKFNCDPVSTQAVLEFTKASADPSQANAREGLFGPVVEVPESAPLFDRALAYAGRNPHWQP